MSTDSVDGAIDRLVDAWCAHDDKRALIPVDREIVVTTRSIRTVICQEAMLRERGRDLLHACARLGAMIGELGGSPTLLATTADGLFESLVHHPGAHQLDAKDVRVAIAEGFAAARRDLARADALLAWEPPHCIVAVDATTVAIAAGFPDDDHDALEGWSARVTRAVLADEKRNAIVSGRADAVRALTDALTLVGITMVPPSKFPSNAPADTPSDGASPGDAPEKTTSWLPWRRNRVK